MRLGTLASVLGLLAHDNPDIAATAVGVLHELTDGDVMEGFEDQAAALVDGLLEANALELLVQSLARFDEKQTDEATAVFNALGVIENMVEVRGAEAWLVGAGTRRYAIHPRSTTRFRGMCAGRRACSHRGMAQQLCAGHATSYARQVHSPFSPRSSDVRRRSNDRFLASNAECGTYGLSQVRKEVAEQVLSRTKLLQWLLSRLKAREFDSNKFYASELLSILMQVTTLLSLLHLLYTSGLTHALQSE